MRLLSAASLYVCAMAIFAPATAAQESSGTMNRASVDGIEIVTGLMSFDLSGTGWDVPTAIRVSKALTDNLALEIGALLSSPHQQFGPSTLVAPEAQLSYSWKFGRARPFVAGGGGVAMIHAATRDTQWKPTISGGGGLRFELNENLYAIGEIRLRGLADGMFDRPSASTAEWMFGVGWMLR